MNFIKLYNVRASFNLQVTIQFILLSLLITVSLPAQEYIAPPPSNFDKKTEVAHGTYQIVPYFSTTVGVTRNARIYFPPGYSVDSTYNVLYLLHGIGGDINEWYYSGVPHYILDNLYADGQIEPMILVLPNGRAMVDDTPGSNIYAADKVAGFANFEVELIHDLVPFIDSTYPVKQGREARAIAGLSMGGGQSLDFGLAHLDTFAYVGAFSPAPNTYAADQLIHNLDDSSKISTLWISCGDADGLFYISQNTHNFMNQYNIDHYFLVEPGKAHDWTVWKPGLYHFARRIFGRTPPPDTMPEPEVPSGIFQSLKTDELKIAYNQADQSMSITGVESIQHLRIYDLNGSLINEFSDAENNNFDLSVLKSGLYLVILNDSRKILHGKIVKY